MTSNFYYSSKDDLHVHIKVIMILKILNKIDSHQLGMTMK